jgi:hypothetical protein
MFTNRKMVLRVNAKLESITAMKYFEVIRRRDDIMLDDDFERDLNSAANLDSDDHNRDDDDDEDLFMMNDSRLESLMQAYTMGVAEHDVHGEQAEEEMSGEVQDHDPDTSSGPSDSDMSDEAFGGMGQLITFSPLDDGYNSQR